MTIQEKHFIDLPDIVALHCECKNPGCGVTLALPLNKAITNEILRTCPKCKHPWAQFGESTFELEISKFIDAMVHLGKIAEKLGFSLSLEIKALPVKASD